MPSLAFSFPGFIKGDYFNYVRTSKHMIITGKEAMGITFKRESKQSKPIFID